MVPVAPSKLVKEKKGKEKNANCVNTTGMDKERMLLCICTTQRMLRHTTPHLENKNKRSFSVGIRWLGGRNLHTTRSVAQIFVGVVFSVSSHLYDFLLRI
jgi:hypothetical protein